MGKKKKIQLKPAVPRGFATTSVPKREEPKAEAPPKPEPVAEVPPVTDAAAETPATDAFDLEAEERQARQNLVDLIYPRVEKETQRRIKVRAGRPLLTQTIEFHQRLFKSLLHVSINPGTREDVLSLVRDGRCVLQPVFLQGTFGNEAQGVPPLTDADHAALAQDAPGRTMLAEVLSTPPAADGEAKALERALTTWSILHALGFVREHVCLALMHAPSLEVEECVAWLVTQLHRHHYHALALNSDTPASVPLDKPALLDDTRPPPHPALEFTRELYGILRTQRSSPEHREEPATSVESVRPETVAELRCAADTLTAELRALLDSDAPHVDAVEHPIEAWCTARMIHVRIDQERGRRRKLLGKRLDAALSAAANASAAESSFRQLKEQADNLMSQSAIQPTFDSSAAVALFCKRMREREVDQAAAAAEQARAEQARQQRRAEMAAAASAGQGDAQASPDGDSDCKADASETDRRDEAALGDPLKDEGTEASPPSPTLDALFDEPEAPQTSTCVRLRTLSLQGSQRSPRALLAEALQHADLHAVVRYTPIRSGSVFRSQLEIGWSRDNLRPRRLDTFRLADEGCETQALADDLVATAALNCFGRERQTQRMLGSGFRVFWDELEAARAVQKDAYLRDEVAVVQELLAQRNVAAPRRAPRRPREDRAPRTVLAPRALLQPQPKLAERWADIVASEQYQAMLPGRRDLPIAATRESILQTIAQSQVVVLSGETGCGKSTQLPAFLLEDCLSRGEPCCIYVTEPRRISAISLAERVSQELGEAPGAVGSASSLVGYSIRLENCVGPSARLVYATTGIVLRMLESSALDEITHIIIDEVHERSIESDFLMIVLRTLMRARPDLKIVLMSATLDAERISTYFGGCPTLAVPGRTFPVETFFLEDVIEMVDYTLEPSSVYARKDERQNRVGVQVAAADDDSEDDNAQVSGVADSNRYNPKTVDTLAHLNEHIVNYELIVALLEYITTSERFADFSRAILVFLPGINEIRECLRGINTSQVLQPTSQLHVLHSSVTSEDQSAAFAPPPAHYHKIVLATNIAETGITIPDITCVIDAGRHREMRFDEKRNISRLVECFVARSNAKQRRGRAGRVQQGVCFHLFTRMRHDEFMEDHPLPEMLRLSLQELALQLRTMPLRIGSSVEDALSQALDPPATESIQHAVASLVEVGALTANEEITSLGRHLCHMPLDVRLAKFLLIAVLFRCTDAALSIAAVLSSKSPFLPGKDSLPGGRRSLFTTEPNDFVAFANMFRRWRQAANRQNGALFCSNYGLNNNVLYQIEELRQQYFAYLVDANFVQVDQSMRNDLARRRVRNGRPRLIEIPGHLDENSDEAPVITLALVAAFYPQLLVAEERSMQMRTLTNNQPAAVHPSSLNARKILATPSAHFVLYHSILFSSRLYAWETALVSDRMVLLVGGEAEFKHTSRSVFLDHNRVRAGTLDAPSLVALRILRVQLRRMIQDFFHDPSIKWTPEQEKLFELVLSLIGVDKRPLHK